jgi:hypothetical protein
MPRIVSCGHCQTLTRMPDVAKGTPMKPARLEWSTGESYVYKDDKGFPVMVPMYDPVLEDFVERHTHGYEDDKVIGGLIKVWTVDQQTWDSVDVVTKVKSEMEKITGQWYEERNEYREEAVKCYNAHGNPDIHNKCIDFMDDSKRIGKGHWRDDDGGEHAIPDRFRQYLCYQCPYVQTAIAVEVRHKRGLYR